MRRLIKAAPPGAAAAACIGSGAGRVSGGRERGPRRRRARLSSLRAAGSGELRLVGGGGRCAGRVEVKHDGEWGSVCAFDFDWEALAVPLAVVVCRQLGCGRVARASLHAPFGPGSGRIWLQPFFCRGTEDALEQCLHLGWGRHFCGHKWDVGVTCTDAVELRLAGGGSPCAGRVEVKLQGHWGTVGDDNWNVADAEVVCQQLGCGSASGAFFALDHFGVGVGPISLALVNCSGDEATLWDCEIRGWGPYNITIHDSDTAVVCQGFSQLVGGDGACAGRLEVRQGRAWVGVCEDEVDMKVAQVVCRELGCGEVIAIAGSGRFGAVSGSLWDGGFQCNGTEPLLSACAQRPAQSQECSGPASVICSSYTGFRLGNGSSGCAGRVEVAVRGTWGSVCASEWDLPDAHVLCRHLGCGRAFSVPPGGSFGSGEGPLRPDAFGCSGSERHPGQCPVAVLGKPPCAPGNAAAVNCSGSGFVTSLRLVDGQSLCDGRLEETITSPAWRRVPLEQWNQWDAYMVCAVLGCGLPKDVYTALGTAPALSSSPSEVDIMTEEMGSSLGMGSALSSSPEEMDDQLEEMGNVSGMGPAANSSLEEMVIVCSGSLRVRLMGSSGRCAGRVEVYSGGSWSWVCQEGWGLQAAAVVCRELGCGTALQAPGWARLGAGAGPLWPYSPACSGSEESLWECGRTERRECGPGGGAGAVCSEQLSVRLAGGPGRCRGFLEISYNGTWGRVCANGTSPSTASTVCRQLGCGQRGWLTAVTAQDSTEAWLAWVGCEDGARSLWQCPSAAWHLQSCRPGGDAHVECEEDRDGTTEGHTTAYPEGASSTGPGRAADAISNAVYEELDYKDMPEYQEVPTPPGSLLEGWVKKLPYYTGDSMEGSDTEAAPDPPAWPEQGPPDGYDDVLAVPQEPLAASSGDISVGMAGQRWICVLPTGQPAVAGQPGHGPGLRHVVLQEVPDVQAGLQGPEGVQFLQQGLAESVRAQPGRGGGRSRGEGVGACGEGGAEGAAVPVRPCLSRSLRCPARACRAWKGPGQGPDSPQAPQRAGGLPELLAELQDALGSQLVVTQVQAGETGPLQQPRSQGRAGGARQPAAAQPVGARETGKEGFGLCLLSCSGCVRGLGDLLSAVAGPAASHPAGQCPPVRVPRPTRADVGSVRCVRLGPGRRGRRGGGAALSAAAQVSGGACGRWRGREPPGGDRLLPALGEASAGPEPRQRRHVPAPPRGTACSWQLAAPARAGGCCHPPGGSEQPGGERPERGALSFAGARPRSGCWMLSVGCGLEPVLPIRVALGRLQQQRWSPGACRRGPRRAGAVGGLSPPGDILVAAHCGEVCDGRGAGEAHIWARSRLLEAAAPQPGDEAPDKGCPPRCCCCCVHWLGRWQRCRGCAGWGPVAMGPLLALGLLVCVRLCGGSGELRLVGGGGRCAGRVEVKHDGEWGSVCAFDFYWEALGEPLAVVVCRQLGCGRVARASLHAPFGPGSGRIWLQPFFCRGTEDTLEQCSHEGWGRHFCSHQSDVGVTCTDAVELRLAGGGSPCAGRVEVKLQGHWGTVVDNSWDMADAEVVCQQLGCGSASGAFFALDHFGVGVGPISLALVNCSGDEATLWDCKIRGWGPYSINLHGSDTAVVCQGFSQLVGGDGACAGRLEVRQGRAWVGVCEDEVDMKVAQVVCRELGCGEVIAIAGSGRFGAVSGSLWVGGFRCNGTEPLLSACAQRPAQSQECSGSASVICSSYTGFRLGNGSSGCAGRVEVAVRGTWGSVCASEWDLPDAHVLCRHLGCGRAFSVPPGGSFGSGEGPLRPDAFGCSGSERHPGQCPVAVLGKPPCAPGNAAAVNCSGSGFVTSLRLVDGQSLCDGRLEETITSPAWRRVPLEQWNQWDAYMVCAVLGCGLPKDVYTALGTAPALSSSPSEVDIMTEEMGSSLGMGSALSSSPEEMDDQLEEMGNVSGMGPAANSSLEEMVIVCSGGCPEKGWRCRCPKQPPQPIPSVPTGSLRVRLMGSSGRCAGRVEVYSGGSWSWVCQEGWGLQAAAVVCRELGCGTALQAPGWARLGAGAGPLWPYSPACSGSEESLWECGRTERRECGRGGGAGAVCSEQLSVRLAGGPGRCRGFLEISYNGTWGRVCANGTSPSTASTVCRQLGCGQRGWLTAVTAQDSTEAWLAWVGCEDGARSLWQCPSAAWHLQSCRPGGDAHVECEEDRDGSSARARIPPSRLAGIPLASLPACVPTGVPRRRPPAVAVGSVPVPTVLCVVLGMLLCLSLGALALLLCRARRRGPGRAADAISNAVYEELDYKDMPEYQEVPTPPGSLLEGWVKKLPYYTGDSMEGSDTEAAPDPPAWPEQGPPDGYDDVLAVPQEPLAASSGDISVGMAGQRWSCVLPTGPAGASREPSEQPPGHMDYDDVGSSALGTLP
ncbi:antigen WC1.1-like [Molothrus ater]|uniref:antigen WC1.1-like n=1 Tax=Molothrus ater TaxID=84834 RepID=UPI0023E88632|nr:antigen WC1.1-like [Molothrus ater]